MEGSCITKMASLYAALNTLQWWVSSLAGVTVTVEGRIAAVILSSMSGIRSKVLVLWRSCDKNDVQKTDARGGSVLKNFVSFATQLQDDHHHYYFF